MSILVAEPNGVPHLTDAVHGLTNKRFGIGQSGLYYRSQNSRRQQFWLEQRPDCRDSRVHQVSSSPQLLQRVEHIGSPSDTTVDAVVTRAVPLGIHVVLAVGINTIRT
jgi:hypothetical protein